MNTYARCQSIDAMVYLKMLPALALMWYENKLYWKSIGAEILQQIDLGRQANLKELLESKELATWGYKY